VTFRTNFLLSYHLDIFSRREVPTNPYLIERNPTASSAEREVYHGLLPSDPSGNMSTENLPAFSSMAQVQDWYNVPRNEPGGANIYSSTSTDNAQGMNDPESTPNAHNTITRQLRRNDAHAHKEETTYLRCFEHGCNGRRFSNKDNYRRHFRERNVVNRADCCFCGITFSRKSNRDAHIASGRCQVVNAMFSDAVDLSQDNR
jgi:hypothetical protein